MERIRVSGCPSGRIGRSCNPCGATSAGLGGTTAPSSVSTEAGGRISSMCAPWGHRLLRDLPVWRFRAYEQEGRGERGGEPRMTSSREKHKNTGGNAKAQRNRKGAERRKKREGEPRMNTDGKVGDDPCLLRAPWRNPFLRDRCALPVSTPPRGLRFVLIRGARTLHFRR